MVAREPLTADDYRDQYQAGISRFAALFTRLMDLNEFSHPTMVSLTRNCMHGVSWLHSSQISGLRHGKLISPGPRTFVAIQQLNYFLHRYITHKKLLPNTDSSNAYQNAWAITENGEAPDVGWFMEVFTGSRVPTDIDLYEVMINQSQAEERSIQWAKLMRSLMMEKNIDIISDLDEVLRKFYPARDAHRVAKIKDVLLRNGTWTPDELKLELPAITAFSQALGGPSDESRVLAA